MLCHMYISMGYMKSHNKIFGCAQLNVYLYLIPFPEFELHNSLFSSPLMPMPAYMIMQNSER